jgi:S1-C subfamily serine protease
VKYTSGDINALSGLHGDQRLMQVSLPIQPGNSGGPVALDDGRVVGVVVSSVNLEYVFKNSNTLPQNVNFAVKADYLRILAKNNGLRLPTGSASGDAKQHVRAYSVQVISE